ncbi:hypothetical protein ACVIKO_002960 [Rhizobium ruizarguesonis]
MTFPNPSAAFDRMLIMGNGGAGKTWLARRIGEQLHHPVVHLDDMHWEPGRYGIDRDRALRDEMVKAAAERHAWVMEGVYGQLANMVLNRTTILIWIDLPEEECIANIKLRGIQGGETGTQFDGLLTWVAAYRSRTNTGIHSRRTRDCFRSFPVQNSCYRAVRPSPILPAGCPPASTRPPMKEPIFPNDGGKDAWMVVPVMTERQWNAYHDIRRAVLFEARGLIGYEANHPDDRRDGHFPFAASARKYSSGCGSPRSDGRCGGVCANRRDQGGMPGKRVRADAHDRPRNIRITTRGREIGCECGARRRGVLRSARMDRHRGRW